MATKKTTTSQEDAVFESGLDEVMAEMQLSQADDETDQEDALSAAQDTLESSLIPQTDSEPLNEDRIPAEDAARNALPDIIPQTDIENENPGEVCSGSMHSNTPDQQIPQTDSDAAETPPEWSSPTRRIRKSRAKKSESGTETEKQPEEVPDGVVEPVKPSRRTTSARPASVVSIDARPTVETEEDKARNDLLDLMESLKSKRILTDTIQGIERPADNPLRSLAVIYHGDIKVIIPAEEAVEPPEDFRGRLPEDVLHYMLTKRLGAEVDYIIMGIDAAAGVAVGSRLEAMMARRKEYYYGLDRDGNNLLYEGICAEARVVSVIRAGIFVDLFGVEVYIPLRELSYQRMMDAQDNFQPGQRILVKILSIDRRDRYHIRVAASIKQAGENPYEKALRRYVVGNRYVGTVSMVDMNGVFVALDGGVDCLCSYPKRGRPPRGARVTVRILGINNEANRIWGAITHVALPR